MFKKLRIQTKLSFIIVTFILFPVVIIVLLYGNRFYDMIIADAIRQEQSSTAHAVPLIEDKLSQITSGYDRITNHDYYKEIFNNTIDTPLVEKAESPNARDFLRYIEDIENDTPVSAVRIYMGLSEDDPFFGHENSNALFLPESLITNTYWHGIFSVVSTPTMYCPERYLGPREISNYGDCAYIFRRNLYYNGEVIRCFFALYYEASELEQILRDSFTIGGSVSFIINERDALVSTTDEALFGLYHLSYDSIQKSLLSSNSFIAHNVLGSSVYMAFHYIETPGWFLATVIPQEPLINRANQEMTRLGIIVVFAIVIAVLLALVLARSITGRLSSVVSRMSSVRTANPTPLPDPKIHDEVGELIDSYNYMTYQINDLRTAEFDSLQAQINPHFLYNTMDMISWMSRQGRAQDVENAVQRLSRFYRLTLSRKGEFSTLRDELEHIQVYVDLQNMRFNDSIDLLVDVPDEITGCSIPKLTLQPIVENSILHGILETRDREGSIVITGWMEGDDVVLLITDDGMGIPPEVLPNILEGAGDNVSTGAHMAVYNTHRRLQIQFGPEYGLSYSSTYGQGCEVTVRIPNRKDNK